MATHRLGHGVILALEPAIRFGRIRLAEFAQRRAYAWKKLNSIPGISCANARGAFYLFPNISKAGLGSIEFCAQLLEQEKVAAVPGVAFGADDYIRISYATSMKNLEKGLDRLEHFMRTRCGDFASRRDRSQPHGSAQQVLALGSLT